MAIVSKLPSIGRLETIASRLVVIGLILLTLGLALAPFLMESGQRAVFYRDAKILWSILVWITYAMVVGSRWIWRFGGRPLAWALIAGFVFLILTFSGTNLMSELHR
jgi:ABC-type uncharacterized transport system permease subunit